MGFTPDDLVHYLCAAAGAIPLDTSGIYLVFEEDNDLIEKLWTGTELADQVFIGSGVRENTPALYLLSDNEVRLNKSVDRQPLMLEQYLSDL